MNPRLNNIGRQNLLFVFYEKLLFKLGSFFGLNWSYQTGESPSPTSPKIIVSDKFRVDLDISLMSYNCLGISTFVTQFIGLIFFITKNPIRIKPSSQS